MMRLSSCRRSSPKDDGVSTILEYITISGIIMVLMVILMLTLNSVFLEGPRDLVSYHSFVDIGNGVSTKLVDLYVIAPYYDVNPSYLNSMQTSIDIPNDVAGGSYSVDLTNGNVVVSRGSIQSSVPIAGIGLTIPANGSATGMSRKILCYNRMGGGCSP